MRTLCPCLATCALAPAAAFDVVVHGGTAGGMISGWSRS